MTRCIVKTAAPILFGAVVSSCKASQIFFHILILQIFGSLLYSLYPSRFVVLYFKGWYSGHITQS